MASLVETEVLEGWGDWVDPREYLTDDPTFRLGGGVFAPISSIEDRLEGKYFPIFEDESTHAEIRGQARNLSAIDAVAIGATDALKHYVIGEGLQAKVSGDNQALNDQVQAIVDRFLDVNDFTNDLDCELHDRSRQDGEPFLQLKWFDSSVRAVVLEPDQITEPDNPRDIEEWLDPDQDFASSWSFGIQTRIDLPHVPLNYYVRHGTSAQDWEIVPAARMVHMKRNVPRNVKRGLSDFYVIMADMRNAAKLSTNMAVGGALQAAIAWVEEFPMGTTQADVNALDQRLREVKQTRNNQDGVSQTTSTHRFQPGTIVRPSPGRKYAPAPMGSERTPAFIEIAQFILRRIGVRWTMPEYMISGDASNANFASTLVAESPFVKAREADQRFYARHFRNMLWKVVRMHVEANRLGIGWEQLQAEVDIDIETPEVASRDQLQMAQRQEIQKRIGILSDRTAATQAGLDYDVEVDQGAKAESPPQPAAAPGRQTTFESMWRDYP